LFNILNKSITKAEAKHQHKTRSLHQLLYKRIDTFQTTILTHRQKKPRFTPLVLGEADEFRLCVYGVTWTEGDVREFVECVGCENWFHSDCVQFDKSAEETENEIWLCPRCNTEYKISSAYERRTS
jgi:hypothetical protein